jgi:hypothetical protein
VYCKRCIRYESKKCGVPGRPYGMQQFHNWEVCFFTGRDMWGLRFSQQSRFAR